MLHLWFRCIPLFLRWSASVPLHHWQDRRLWWDHHFLLLSPLLRAPSDLLSMVQSGCSSHRAGNSQLRVLLLLCELFTGIPIALCMGCPFQRTHTFIWECNGLPQQQFVMDYANEQGTDMYLGQLRFPNGKCLDATSPISEGNTPIAWSCNGLDQQVWGTCAYKHGTGQSDICGEGHETGPCVGMGLLTV